MKRAISAVVSGFESACINLCELFLLKIKLFRHTFSPYTCCCTKLRRPVCAEEYISHSLLFFPLVHFPIVALCSTVGMLRWWSVTIGDWWLMIGNYWWLLRRGVCHNSQDWSFGWAPPKRKDELVDRQVWKERCNSEESWRRGHLAH